MDYQPAPPPLAVFSSPRSGKKGQILGRISTITSEFWRTITPYSPPSPSDIEEALMVLGMDTRSIACCYCGDKKSEWDHLRPIVLNKRPTGYITELQNLVPSCGKCNQSKGGKEWRVWMLDSSKNSPTSRGISDVHARIARLDAYENWRAPTRIDFESAAGTELWEQYLSKLDAIRTMLSEADSIATEIREKVSTSFSG